MRLAVSHHRVIAMPGAALVLALSLGACHNGEGETSSASPTALGSAEPRART